LEHPGGLVITLNVGHHLPPASPEEINSILATTIGWMHEQVVQNPKNVVAFRETTPSHFPNSNNDGEYIGWVTAAKKQKHAVRYNCSSNNNHLRRENVAAARLLRACGKECKVHLIPLTRFLDPFWKLKVGQCSLAAKLDCVHYCAFSPPMWMPAWEGLLKILSTNLSTTSDQVTKTSKIQLVQYVNATLTQAVPERYAVQWGLRRLVRDLRPLELELRANFSAHPPVFETLTKEALDAIPLGIPYDYHDWPDGTLLRPQNTREIFYVNHSHRHSVSDYEMLKSLHPRSASIVALHDLDLMKVPVGDRLCNDWNAAVAHTRWRKRHEKTANHTGMMSSQHSR
jgi:hypothetical protein